MQISLTREQEEQLTQIAAQRGKKADELAGEVFNRGLAAETHFLNAIRIGQQAAHRGDFLEASEVWAGVEQVLKP
jgi:predicted transcriptional regulator